MIDRQYIKKLNKYTQEFYDKHNFDFSHNFEHVITVAKHVKNVLQNVNIELSNYQKHAIYTAALLHDTDDYKYFGDNNYQNMYNILKKTFSRDTFSFITKSEDITSFINLVKEMIELVSCSKNKNKTVDLEWKLIPRYCDRVEAIGEIGILRCYIYCTKIKLDYFIPNVTPLVKNRQNLFKVATNERFKKYNGISRSMIDHYYDKILHIGKYMLKNKFILNNKFLYNLYKQRHETIIKFILKFGQTGTVDKKYINNLCNKYKLYQYKLY